MTVHKQWLGSRWHTASEWQRHTQNTYDIDFNYLVILRPNNKYTEQYRRKGRQIRRHTNILVVVILKTSWKEEFVATKVVFDTWRGEKKKGLPRGNSADKLNLLFDCNNCSSKTTKERIVETRKWHFFSPPVTWRTNTVTSAGASFNFIFPCILTYGVEEIKTYKKNMTTIFLFYRI
jgi:hypothetical protein